MKKQSTLCFIRNGSKILLGLKKRGFGAGRWNGYGGKVMLGEDIEDSLRREIMEEAQITLGDVQKGAVIDFFGQGLFDSKSQTVNEIHVFQTEDYSGTPVETEEMRPQWFDISELPFDLMWPDDRFWLPRFLAGEKLVGRFEFGPGDKLLSYEIKTTEQL